ncbi:Uncharacterised protein [Mycobacteroides abscessus subsp. abscessus]|nr:Uncharacterised protein [Mycobacteroides abscessus subsp. abscessus]
MSPVTTGTAPATRDTVFATGRGAWPTRAKTSWKISHRAKLCPPERRSTPRPARMLTVETSTREAKSVPTNPQSTRTGSATASGTMSMANHRSRGPRTMKRMPMLLSTIAVTRSSRSTLGSPGTRMCLGEGLVDDMV